ncbi:hypothetical protein ACFL01_03630 [Planctomycetota bacterium]
MGTHKTARDRERYFWRLVIPDQHITTLIYPTTTRAGAANKHTTHHVEILILSPKYRRTSGTSQTNAEIRKTAGCSFRAVINHLSSNINDE